MTTPNMLRAALWYARQGLHIFPCHEPLFDHPKGYTCTCEDYRHSDRCKQQHPHRYLLPGQHCDRSGKHPRGLQHGLLEATTDEAQIKVWWGKYPTANIGCVPGRAGYAVLDADAYKEEYGGADMLTPAEEGTPTSLTGNGGAHLWYKKHDGATYSNAPGSLPPGVDVRSDNGYVILPPSLHKSGNRYQWELGYGLHEMEAQTLPQRIHDILIAATAKSSSARRGASFSTAQRWDGKPSTQAPDLDTWRLSAEVRQLIAKGTAKGKRSEADAKVCVSLVYAGATDDDILAVFEHHPIGTAGKFAEGGRRYLDTTITAARTYAEEHPRPPDVAGTLAAVRRWLHSIDLAEYVPADQQSANCYRTRERDLAVADAALEAFEGYHSLEGPLGLRQLRRMANLGGLATTRRALSCLVPWLLEPVEPDTTAPAAAANVYRLAPAAIESASKVVAYMEHQHTPPNVIGVPPTQQPYSEYRAHDAFNATTTPITADDIAEREAAGRPYSTRYTLTPIYRRRVAAALPGIGRTGLVLVNALVNAGGFLPMRELVGLGGRSKFTVSRAVNRLAFVHLVTVDDSGVTLREDWQEWIDAITDLMPTAGNGRRRIVQECKRILADLEQRQEAAEEGGAPVPEWAERRAATARKNLERFAPDFYRLHVAQWGVTPRGRTHTGANGMLLVEELPELRRRAERYGVQVV